MSETRHGIIPDEAAARARLGIAPVARALHTLRVGPNAVSVAGLALTIAGAALLAVDQPWWALLALLFGSTADAVDGELARISGRATTFGAFLDATLDRLSDAALFVGASLFAFRTGDPLVLAAALWSLVASFMVSYVRAKAEALARAARVGLAPREARLSILLAGIALWALLGNARLFGLAMAITALLATATVVQRVIHVSRQQ